MTTLTDRTPGSDTHVAPIREHPPASDRPIEHTGDVAEVSVGFRPDESDADRLKSGVVDDWTVPCMLVQPVPRT